MTIAAALLAFLPVAIALVLVPGVNNLVVLRETVAHGRPGGYAAIAGTSIGILAWSAAVAAGLGALAVEHPREFTWLQMAGASLLVATGVRTGSRLLRRPDGVLVQADTRSRPDGTTTGFAPTRASFRAATLTSLANPRCPVTAVSVLPQFVAPGSAAAGTTLALGTLWTVVAGAWNVLGVLLAHRGRGLLSRPRPRRVVEGVSAGALIALGISVAVGAGA